VRAESQGELSILQMCQLTGVSRASFYRHWEQKSPEAAEMALRDAIQRAALKHRYYGYRRIAVLIEREGFQVGAKKVRRLMRDDNLLAIRRRKFAVTTDSDHRFQVYPNLAQHLVLCDVNQLWVADLTYLRLAHEFVYLAVILDAWSRRAVGWALGRKLDRRLAALALERAIAARRPQPGLVHHSDQGCQYASGDYVKRLEAIGAVASMSRAGSPWENGICESFIGTLKREEIDARPYASYVKLEEHIEEFLSQIYNAVRLHSALGYRSPEEFEKRQAQAKSLPAWLPAAMSFSRREEIVPPPAPGHSAEGEA
jgi:transposase InsO family protein